MIELVIAWMLWGTDAPWWIWVALGLSFVNTLAGYLLAQQRMYK